MSDLQNQYIDDTFDGLLHANGQSLGSGLNLIYDGSGQASALSLGLASEGATISGLLSSSTFKVGSLTYPSEVGTTGSVAYLSDPNTISFTSSLPSTVLAPLSPSPSGRYGGYYDENDDFVRNHIYNVTINSKGLVTDVKTTSELANPNSYTNITYMRNGRNAENNFKLISGDTSWVGVNLKSDDDDTGFGERPTSVTIGLFPDVEKHPYYMLDACASEKPLIIDVANTSDGLDAVYTAVLDYSATKFTVHKQLRVKLGRTSGVGEAKLWFRYRNDNYPETTFWKIEIIAAHI